MADPNCQTCGGYGQIVGPLVDYDEDGNQVMTWGTIKCPDC